MKCGNAAKSCVRHDFVVLVCRSNLSTPLILHVSEISPNFLLKSGNSSFLYLMKHFSFNSQRESALREAMNLNELIMASPVVYNAPHLVPNSRRIAFIYINKNIIGKKRFYQDPYLLHVKLTL